MSELIVVNFSHPLTRAQRDRIAELTGQPIARVIDVPVHLDETEPFAPQIAALAAAAGLTAAEWQTLPLLVNLPAYAPVVAGLLAYLHGLSGHFPAAIRMRPVRGSTPAVFEVAEILGLQELRAGSRSARRTSS